MSDSNEFVITTSATTSDAKAVTPNHQFKGFYEGSKGETTSVWTAQASTSSNASSYYIDGGSYTTPWTPTTPYPTVPYVPYTPTVITTTSGTLGCNHAKELLELNKTIKELAGELRLLRREMRRARK